MAQLAKGIMAFGIFVSHGLACYVAIDITWNEYIKDKLGVDKKKIVWEFVVRTLLVFVTCMYRQRPAHLKMATPLKIGSNFSFSFFVLALQLCWPLRYQIWNCSSLCSVHCVCRFWVLRSPH